MGFASYQEDIVSRRAASDRSWKGGRPRAAPREVRVSMNKLKEFTTSSARPLPVIVLADVSGSMAEGGKIQSLNQAIREMLETFRDEEDLRAEIHAAVLTFGNNQASWQAPLGPAAQVTWADMAARGNTPMGAAFTATLSLLEDRNAIPSRAYRPTLVLVSDGQPNDEWKAPLDALLASERGGKAQRLALGIGADADLNVLSDFLRDPASRVLRASDARGIRNFFKLVTMSVTSRSRSANPNAAPSLPADGEWDL